MGEKVAVVGELADKVAGQEAAADEVERAQQAARELIDRARADGRRLVAEAQASVEAAEVDYGQVYRRALGAGWSNAELQQMGYPAPARQRHRPAGSDAEDNGQEGQVAGRGVAAEPAGQATPVADQARAPRAAGDGVVAARAAARS
jgi:hypothetical protein